MFSFKRIICFWIIIYSLVTEQLDLSPVQIQTVLVFLVWHFEGSWAKETQILLHGFTAESFKFPKFIFLTDILFWVI